MGSTEQKNYTFTLLATVSCTELKTTANGFANAKADVISPKGFHSKCCRTARCILEKLLAICSKLDQFDGCI